MTGTVITVYCVPLWRVSLVSADLKLTYRLLSKQFSQHSSHLPFVGQASVELLKQNVLKSSVSLFRNLNNQWLTLNINLLSLVKHVNDIRLHYTISSLCFIPLLFFYYFPDCLWWLFNAEVLLLLPLQYDLIIMLNYVLSWSLEVVQKSLVLI